MRVIRSALVLCLAAAAAAASAGTVAVSFANQGRFADAGRMGADEEANLRVIAQHLQTLGRQHLPADQTLRVEVTGVDLAGELLPSARRGNTVRIVRGRADFPSISLRYTLEAGGRVVKSGEESISDLDYTHYVGVRHTHEPLSHEKRLLDRWFRTRLLATAAD